MNRILQFYNYEQCYAHYTKRIMSIRQAKIRGEIIVAKPVLLLSIIDGIDANVFPSNYIKLDGDEIFYIDEAVHERLSV